MSEEDFEAFELVDGFDSDPNAATPDQAALKRIESMLRRHCDSELFLMLDGIALLQDPQEIRTQMVKLTKKLQETMAR